MEQKNLQCNNAEYSMTIPTSRPLWNYLLHGQKNSSKKLSRVEAFRDIIERQHSALLSGTDDGIGASVIELTKAWHWNRDTTSAFIDSLRRLGAVTCEKDGNRTIIRLNHTSNEKHFWNLREALRGEKSIVSDQRNMNSFLWSYTPRKRHNFEYDKMAYGNSGGTPALERASQSLEMPRRRLRVWRHSAIGVAYYPPIGINATRGEPHTKVEQAQWQVGSGIPRDPSLKTFIKPF